VGSVVLDLRGNPGGSVSVLTKLVGGFFAHDVRIGDRKRRKDSEPQIAKTRGGKAFGGKLIVLVDSRSSSAAEIFARVVQLEKRGVVLGDRSAGAVMEAQFFPHAELVADRSSPSRVRCRRKQRALDRSGPLCTPQAPPAKELLLIRQRPVIRAHGPVCEA
jgi:C-terminal processing protease CtpA/Prc